MSRNVCHVLTHMLAQLLVIFSCELVALQRHGASAHPNTHTPLPPAVVFQHMASFWQTSLHCEQAMNQQTGILPSCLLVMQVAKWTECLDPCTLYLCQQELYHMVVWISPSLESLATSIFAQFCQRWNPMSNDWLGKQAMGLTYSYRHMQAKVSVATTITLWFLYTVPTLGIKYKNIYLWMRESKNSTHI